MYEAARNGHIEVVQWLAGQGATGGKDIDDLTARRVALIAPPPAESDNQASDIPPPAAVEIQEDEEWEEDIVYKPRGLGPAK